MIVAWALLFTAVTSTALWIGNTTAASLAQPPTYNPLLESIQAYQERLQRWQENMVAYARFAQVFLYVAIISILALAIMGNRDAL